MRQRGRGGRTPILAALCGLALLLAAPARITAASAAEASSRHLERGRAFLEKGRLDKAWAELRAAAAFGPDSVEAQYLLGRTAFEMRRYHDAFLAFKEVLSLQKHYKDTRTRFEKTLPLLLAQVKAELVTNPRSARAYGALGFILLYRNRISEGIEQLRYAVRFDPGLATAHDDLAWAYYRMNRFDEALRHSEKAFALDPVRASITRHYKQLFYIQRIGLASDPSRARPFYEGLSERTSGPSAPPRGVAGAAGRAAETGGRRKAGGGSAGTSDSAGSIDISAPALEIPARRDPRPSTPGEGGMPPRQGGEEATRTGTPATPPTTQALSRVRVDDSGILEGFLDDFTPAPALVRPVAPPAPPEPEGPDPEEVARRVRSLYERGAALTEGGDYEGALGALGILREIDPTYRDTPQLIKKLKRYVKVQKDYENAQEYYHAGSFAAAAEAFRRLDLRTLEEIGGPGNVTNFLGECYFRANRFREAAKNLKDWASREPTDLRLRFLLVRALYKLERFQEALEEAGAISGIDPDFLDSQDEWKQLRFKIYVKNYFPLVAGLALVWLILSAGYIFYRLRKAGRKKRLRDALAATAEAQKENDWEAVLAVCEDLGTGESADVRLKQSRALALLELGRTTEARKAVEDIGDPARARALRAKLRLSQQDLSEEAMVEYRALLAAEPNNLKLLRVMSQYLQTQGSVDDEAEAVFKRLSELEPLKAEHVAALGQLYLARGQVDGTARACFKRLVDEDPTNHTARYGLARCLFENDQFIEALREAKQVVEADVEHPGGHRLLVSCYRTLEMLEEGQREYEKLASAYPEAQVIEASLQELRTAAATPATDLDDTAIERSFTAGSRLFGEGRFEEAVPHLMAAFNGHDNRIYAGALLVRCCLRLNDVERACQVFEEMSVFGLEAEDFLLDLCYEMGGVYEEAGNLRMASRLFNFICRANVSFKDAFQRLEQLQDRLTA